MSTEDAPKPRRAVEPAAEPDVVVAPPLEQLPPRPRTYRDTTVFKIGMVLLATVLAVTAIIVWRMVTTPDAPKVGDCLALNQTADEMKYAKIGCDDTSKGVPYLVTASVDDSTACGEFELPYTSTKRSSGETVSIYCLTPKLQKDQCYDESQDFLKPSGCEPGPGVLRVVDEKQGADQTCSEDDPLIAAINFDNPAPGVTYCVRTLEN